MEQQIFRLDSSNVLALDPWLPVGFLFFFLFFVTDFLSNFRVEPFFDFFFGFDLFDLVDIFDDFSVRFLSDFFFDSSEIFRSFFPFFLSFERHFSYHVDQNIYYLIIYLHW